MKLLLITNNAPLYREGIYSLMDKTFNCDWVFGEAIEDIKQLDTKKLRGNVRLVKNIEFFSGRAYWLKGIIRYLFEDYSYYIILGEERCLSSWLFIILSRFLPNKKVFFWTHGPYGKEGVIKRLIQFFYYRFVDGGFVYSNYSRNILIARGLNKKKYVTIHNSLNYNKQIELRISGLESDVYLQYFGNRNPVLLFIGRLTKVKKLDILVEAVHKLILSGNKYNLVFVGDGSENESLLRKVTEYGVVENVWFYGACYDERKNAELIYNADLCVAPGNVGLTAMHSMVFGTPVISHNDFSWQMPEFEAIHPGTTGDFFERDNVDSLCECISHWFSEKHDRDKVRKACFEEIDSQWNPNFQIRVIENLISD